MLYSQVLFIALSASCLFSCSSLETGSEAPYSSRLKSAVYPSTPNYVSSLSPQKKRFIEPIPVESSSHPFDDLLPIIESLPRSKVITVQENYLHAEFRSAIFSFVDDVEFLYLPSEKTLHMCSAARLGYYDFAVNRKRLETIRQLYNSQLKNPNAHQ